MRSADGKGPGRDWILPNGNIVFRSDNSTTRFKAPCCIVFEKLGMVTPDWARRDPPTYMGIEPINVSACFQTGGKPAQQMAHKWSQAGAMGPTDTNYYWQLTESTTEPQYTAQYGGRIVILSRFVALSVSLTLKSITIAASEFGFRPNNHTFGNPNISAGYFRFTRPITARAQSKTLLVPPSECYNPMTPHCPTPTGQGGCTTPGGCAPKEQR